VDPFAGSYVVEAMTDEVEALAVALMDRVAEFGSAVEAIEAGFQKREIESSAFSVAQEIDSGERVVVGVNRFLTADEEPYHPLRVDPAIEAEQGRRLAALRAARDASAVGNALDELRKAAEGVQNVLYPLRTALAARATVGEVCDALRDVWGVYRPASGV
jgi:methylmalonyl-CoA mutase N-terminal domain/subunit